MSKALNAITGGLVAGMIGLSIVGCHGTHGTSPTSQSAAQVQPGQRGAGQQAFATPQQAADALKTAAQHEDWARMQKLFGPMYDQLLSGDRVQDGDDLKRFGQHAGEGLRVEEQTPTHAVLYVGKNQWPFPIPLVKGADGQWFFDTPTGKSRILARRIGRDELQTLRVFRAYLQAQREYASTDEDGSGVLKYAQHFISATDKHDGLYWPQQSTQPQSPLGPLVAEASAEGYDTARGHGPRPFHGYYFHILKSQGPHAPGGAYNYVINGNMIAGFGLVAWPARYGSSGIMTFVMNHNGKIYQKDLGPDTPDKARQIRSYDPDSSWQLVTD